MKSLGEGDVGDGDDVQGISLFLYSQPKDQDRYLLFTTYFWVFCSAKESAFNAGLFALPAVVYQQSALFEFSSNEWKAYPSIYRHYYTSNPPCFFATEKKDCYVQERQQNQMRKQTTYHNQHPNPFPPVSKGFG